MKILTTTSYYGTGSSAITDLISEFDNVKSLSSYEFRFAHDPDGLSELEYNLVENFNRHNSGHALKRYKQLVDYYGAHFLLKRYEAFFNNKWKKISYEYIEDLVDFSYPGIWQYDFYDKGRLYEFFYKLPNRIMHLICGRNNIEKNLSFHKDITYASHPSKEKFIEVTQKYTEKLFQEANNEKQPFLMVDQLLPSTNIERHMRYFKNIKVFVVDRDPRDIYLSSKYIWNDSIVPKDIEIFCKWYIYVRSTRKTENWDKDKIMFINFEDLIYNYDKIEKKIIEWSGLDEKNHLFKFKNFNPEKSKKNTRLWITHPEYRKEAEFIANKLPEYLYNVEDKID